MAPIEVIDLLSSDDESPSKLLQSFKPRANDSRAVPRNKITAAEQNRQSRPSTIHVPTVTRSTGAQQKTFPRQVTDAHISSKNLQSHSPRPVQRTAQAADSSGPSSTPLGLSEEAWNALGPPGRKLQQDFARIQRDLNDLRRQSEPQRQERIDKAEIFQQRRLSVERSHGHIPRKEAHGVSGHTGHGVHSEPEPAVHIARGLSPATTSVTIMPTSSLDTYTYKRPLDTPSTRVTPIKKRRLSSARDGFSHGKAHIADITDATAERFTTSCEPELEHKNLANSIPRNDQSNGRHTSTSDDHASTIQPRVLQQPSPPDSFSTHLIGLDGNDAPQDGSAVDVANAPAPSSTALASIAPNSEFKKPRKPFTAEDNALLMKLKGDMKMEWSKIHRYFPERSLPTLQVHYSTKVRKMQIATSGVALPAISLSQASPALPQASNQVATSITKFGTQYSDDEVALLKKLKEEDHLDWKAMVPYFNGRTYGSLQVYYSTKIQHARTRQEPDLHKSDSAAPVRSKRARKNNAAATDGFLSWADAKSLMRDGIDKDHVAEDVSDTQSAGPLVEQDSVFPRTLNRALRQRELGHAAGTRAWSSFRCTVFEDLKDKVYHDYRLQQYYHGTSGDVVGLSWSGSGTAFAAGSIAIADSRSMQYNMSRNLLVGDIASGNLQELVEHHIARPIVEESDNPNTLAAMRRTQDPRLFLTVTSTAFSPLEDHTLFTTGTDRMLRKYAVAADVRETTVTCSAEHKSSVDLLAVHQEGFVATGCHLANDSINVFSCGPAGLEKIWTGSPSRQDLQSTASIFPSSLKWGAAYVHRNHLLAGFSGDEDRLLAGETVLWDVQHQKQLEIRGTTRNVFDVCWNPRPSSASVVFAVASNSTGMNLGRGVRTVISCFAPSQPLAAVVKWACPALDINDVVICPHNDQLVAAGATDGKIYVWDQRWAGEKQGPLHVLSHGQSLNVLPHDVDMELTDTGVRFLSWGATSSRLYTGSSDGIVKVWNPYRSQENAWVEDIDVPRQHRSAVMSGAFSPDYRELLIGTENGRVNLFKMGDSRHSKAKQMKLHTATVLAGKAGESSRGPANKFLCSGEIVNRPCGAMPLLQAVQGEAYNGPFLAPSIAEEAAAEQDLQNALDAQTNLVVRCAQEGYSDPHDPVLEKAQIRVRDAQAAIVDLRDRLCFAEQSHTKAKAFQSELLDAREQRKQLLKLARERFDTGATACELDCTHLPTSEEIDDNRRSELRIPVTLRIVSGAATCRTYNEDEASDVCLKCFPLQARKAAKRHLCMSCKLDNMRLTTTCTRCSAPARVETEESKQALCEACAFSCFRCAGPVKLSDDSTLVSCGSCKLSWSAGVLGYDLVDNAAASRPFARNCVQYEQYEQYEDFGVAHRECLADNWVIEQDDMMFRSC